MTWDVRHVQYAACATAGRSCAAMGGYRCETPRAGAQGSIGFEPVQVVPGGRGTLVVVGGAAAAVIGNSLLTTLAGLSQ